MARGRDEKGATEDRPADCDGCRELREMLDSAPDTNLLIDGDGVILECNKALERRFGRSREDLIGSRAQDLTPDHPWRIAAAEAVFQTGQTRCLVDERDGMTLESTLYPVFAPDGRVRAVGVHAADITAQKKAQDALEATQSLLEGVLESTSDLIVARDLDGRTTYFNQAFADLLPRLLGVEAEVGQRTMDYLPGPAQGHWGAVLSKVHGGQVHRQEFAWTLTGDDEHFYELTMVPIRQEGRVIGSAEFTRDITHRKRIEARMAATQRMEALGRLCAGVSHEYNNLLMGIIGYAHHLQRRIPEAGEAQDFAGRIIDLSEQATRVSRRLLDFTRSQGGEPVESELDALVGKILDTFRPTIGEDLAIEADLQARAQVLVDPDQIQDVLINLILNARDAMPAGGRLRVSTERASPSPDQVERLDLAPETPWAVVRVADNGEGMDPTTLDRIFEPFFSTKGPGAGSGLGLSACLGIVRAHHGRIDVQSRPGQGTTMTIYLPIRSDAPDPGNHSR